MGTTESTEATENLDERKAGSLVSVSSALSVVPMLGFRSKLRFRSFDEFHFVSGRQLFAYPFGECLQRLVRKSGLMGLAPRKFRKGLQFDLEILRVDLVPKPVLEREDFGLLRVDAQDFGRRKLSPNMAA